MCNTQPDLDDAVGPEMWLKSWIIYKCHLLGGTFHPFVRHEWVNEQDRVRLTQQFFQSQQVYHATM